MHNETHTFLTSRKAELERQIKAATAPLQAELDMVDAGLKAFHQPDMFKHRERERTRPNTEAKTVPQQILALLEENTEGLSSKDVTHYMSINYNRTLSRGNTSSYLSIMKKDGLVAINERGLWEIVKKEPPEGGSQ